MWTTLFSISAFAALSLGAAAILIEMRQVES
jgi:hypothetical protein